METTSILNILVIVAAALLVLVSGGIIYLTALEWRDRRLQEKDKKNNR
ncbi:hypothetical protein [Gloeothece verrucosa]|nr:hypothetical protein [Gloeothece verrucosa]